MKYGYARVSTDEQVLDTQIHVLEAAGVDRSCIEAEKCSGAKLRKPALENILQELGEGDELHVVDLTRLGRVLKELIRIGEVIQERKAELYLGGIPVDFTTSSGRLYYHILGSMAQHEREQVVERTVRSQAVLRAEGKPVGRPRATTSGQDEVIKRMLDQGFSYRDISGATGLSLGTISRIKQEATDEQAVREDPSIMREARKQLAARRKALEKASKDFQRAAASGTNL